jgi:hypothetical protein
MICCRCLTKMLWEEGIYFEGWVKGWHCLLCGNWEDNTVLKNRNYVMPTLPKGFHHFSYKRRQNTKEVV